MSDVIEPEQAPVEQAEPQQPQPPPETENPPQSAEPIAQDDQIVTDSDVVPNAVDQSSPLAFTPTRRGATQRSPLTKRWTAFDATRPAQPSFSFGTRGQEPRATMDVPGPGQYDVAAPRTPDAKRAGCTLGARFPEPQLKVDVPGPGHYELERYETPKKSSESPSFKDVKSKIYEDTPGSRARAEAAREFRETIAAKGNRGSPMKAGSPYRPTSSPAQPSYMRPRRNSMSEMPDKKTEQTPEEQQGEKAEKEEQKEQKKAIHYVPVSPRLVKPTAAMEARAREMELDRKRMKEALLAREDVLIDPRSLACCGSPRAPPRPHTSCGPVSAKITEMEAPKISDAVANGTLVLEFRRKKVLEGEEDDAEEIIAANKPHDAAFPWIAASQ